jgi:Glycosyl hydrolase family 47
MYIMFISLYLATDKYLKFDQFHLSVNMFSAHPIEYLFTSLECFWSGLQVLHGDLIPGVRKLEFSGEIHKKYGLMPESLYLNQKTPFLKYNLLRPEVVESIYMINSALKDSGLIFYLDHIVQNILQQLRKKNFKDIFVFIYHFQFH